MLLLGIIIGLIVLVAIVALHELGHALVARKHGVVVEEFGIGLPPRAWKKKLKNGVLFTLNWLPIGGFVKLQGEHDASKKKGDYGAATFWQKTQILLAGVVVNWLLAVVLLTVLAWIGLPKIIPNQFSIASDTSYLRSPLQITQLKADFPAAEAGLQAGDVITELNGAPVTTVEEFIEKTAALRGESVVVDYKRDGVSAEATVTLKDAESGVFGAGIGQSEKLRATWSAPIVGVVTTGQYTWATLQGLGNLVGNTVSGLAGQLTTNPEVRKDASERLKEVGDSVAGPVGILGVIFPAASQAGPTQVLFLAAIISLTLAVMNILPIPSLDGGRWFVTALFRVMKKPLTKEKEESIHGTGFLILLLLIVVITVADILKLF